MSGGRSLSAPLGGMQCSDEAVPVRARWSMSSTAPSAMGECGPIIGDSWWQLFVAAFLAIVFAQLAFIGHDAGHKQIFRTRRHNNVIGTSHGGLVGMSYGWWISGHNRHHANRNHEEQDRDLKISALAFTQGHG
jgi:fatty acid desaturase